MLVIRWSLLRNHLHLKIFRMSKTEGELASSTPEGGGWLVPGLEGEGRVNFNFLLGREQTGEDSLQVAEAGEAIVRKRW
jgi:hypothetical protein